MDKLHISLNDGEVSFNLGLDVVTLIALEVPNRFQYWTYNNSSEFVMVHEDISGDEAFDLMLSSFGYK